MSDRSISSPRVRIEHPRRPRPSYATLDVTIDWLGSKPIVSCQMTESDLTDLAEEALKVANILRRQTAPVSSEDDCPCGHVDSEHVHYCSHEEREGSCDCNEEYARLPGVTQ